VSEFLEPANAARCEAAALALGKSRLDEALDPLKSCFERAHSTELRLQILLAIGILRRPAATDYLMELIASGSEPDAIAALSVLKIYKHDPHLRDRVATVVQERRSPALQARSQRDFRMDE
jgi:hypothetical protein